MRLILAVALSVCLTGCPVKKEEEKQAAAPAPPAVFLSPVAEATPAAESIPSSQVLGPMESIKELDRKIESYRTGSNLTQEEVEANRKLKQEIIRGTFDLYELCKLALDIHWNEIADKDQRYFTDLMTSLLEKKAIFSKEQVKGEEKGYKVVYKQEKFIDAEKKKSQVSTKILVPSKKVDLDLNYKLTLAPAGWKIFDVIVDDASLVENYKFQFDAIIRKNGYPELVKRMENKLKEMD
ncbi:MAG: ABC transporter substrate-binding protein [Deltaproteobacteria bacterium]|nr:ABC transporter substrate-binding protein [Deltaproteobacteria bacterium]